MSETTEPTSRSATGRDEILETAVEQIGRYGYEAVRLRDIARAAGVSIGRLQHDVRRGVLSCVRICEGRTPSGAR